MLDTTQAVVEYLTAISDSRGLYFEFAGSYGEPGYETNPSSDTETPLVVLGSYWCRCDAFVDTDGTYPAGDPKLHDIARHYPHTFARLEAQGVEFEWHDEWIVDHENDKAYRTQSDSYQWQPSYVLTDDGELLTPDDDIETWVEWAANDSSRCIPARVYSGTDLEAAGFTLYNTDGHYESGWHDGQNGDPRVVTEQLRREHGDEDSVTVVFALDETSQFYIGFSAYYRKLDDDTSDEAE
jgi:hypothetical protein